MGVFDEILARVTPEDRLILDKYPDLKASTDKMERDLGEVSRFAGSWVNWQNQNWDPQAGMTKAEKQLRDQLDAAQARLATGVNAGEDAATVDRLRKEFETKIGESQKQSLQAIEGMNYFYRATAKRMLPHQREFGEDLDPQILMEYMQKNSISDPDLAYDRMVGTKRAENTAKAAKDLEEKHAAEIVAAEQRGAEKRAQELAMGPNGVLPTDMSGGISGITSQAQRPAISDDMKAKVAEAKLGDGSLAQLGYEQYRRGELPVQ